ELDELATAMAVLDERVHSTGKQIDVGHQGHRAVAFILVIALRGGVGAGNRREIRSGIADRLNPRFLVVREDGDFAPAITLRGCAPHLDLAVNTKHFCHFRLELGVALLHVIADFVRFDLMCRQDLAHRSLGEFCQARMAAGGPWSRACAANRRVVHSSCGYPDAIGLAQASDTSHALASRVITASRPARGRSSSAAKTPNCAARSRHRITVCWLTPICRATT